MFIRPLRRLLGRPLAISYFHTTPTSWASRKVIQKFKLADIGEGITECEVIKWSVNTSAKVQAFDPLCEVQSDKASVEITSPFDGVVKELLVQEGEIAKVGAGLCLIEVDEETLDEVDSTLVEPLDTSTSSATPAQSDVDVLAPSPHSPSAQEAALPSMRRFHPLDPNSATSSGNSNHKDILAPPSVRHFARKNGVDLSKLAPGSGKDGRIEKRDVEAFLAELDDTPQEFVPLVAQRDDVVVELGRTRYGMWKAMVKSLEIPHFGYSTTLDLTELYNLLPILNANIPNHYLPPTASSYTVLAVDPSSIYPAPSSQPVPITHQYTKLTYLPVLLKTLSRAMIEWPLFRSSITPNTSSSSPPKPTLTVRPHADISIALSTPSGLYTPTIQRVDTHSIYSLASQLKNLSSLGRQVPCGLSVAEMPKRGGTLTVSNVGALGDGDYASPVLVPGGGVAIVAIGRAKWVWDVNRGDGRDGKGERRFKVGISWSADHRVVEGAEMAAFVECWRGYVETPQRLVGEAV